MWKFRISSSFLPCYPFLFQVFFQNIQVDFWPLLKAEKVLPQSIFWRDHFFLLQNLNFFIHMNLQTFRQQDSLHFKKKLSIVTALI